MKCDNQEYFWDEGATRLAIVIGQPWRRRRNGRMNGCGEGGKMANTGEYDTYQRLKRRRLGWNRESNVRSKGGDGKMRVRAQKDEEWKHE